MSFSNELYLSVDIGGTAMKYALMTKELEFIQQEEMPTNAHLGGKHIEKNVLTLIKKAFQAERIQEEFIGIEKDHLRSKRDSADFQGLGNHGCMAGIAISTAGMVNPNTGEILHAGPQIPDYKGINLKRAVQDQFSIPCYVDNDVKCAGIAEMHSGAGIGYSSALILTIGTGIGACFASRNQEGQIRVFRGHGYSAFEVGYMYQGDSSFQEAASTSALIRRVAEKTGEVDLTGREIFKRGIAGDRICIEALENMIDQLSIGIANLCYVVNPQVVILGGGLMEQNDFFEPHLKEALKTKMIPMVFRQTDIAFARHKNNAGMLGALVQLLQSQRKIPHQNFL